MAKEAEPIAAGIVSQSLADLAAISDDHYEEKLKGVQYIIFACTCPVSEFLGHSLQALVKLCMGRKNDDTISIAQHRAMMQYIVDEGAVVPLVQLCKNNGKVGTKFPNKTKPDGNSMAALVGPDMDAADLVVLADATHALGLLAFSDMTRATIMLEGAVKPLVKLVNEFADTVAVTSGSVATPAAPASSSSSVSLRAMHVSVLVNSLKALGTLAKHGSSRLQIVQVQNQHQTPPKAFSSVS